MMTENSEKAFGSNYFNSPELPVAVAEVSASPLAQHAHDLTERDHFHDFSELVLVTGGSGSQIVDGIEYPVAAGDLFLIQGHSCHRFTDRRTVSLLNVQFDPERLALPYSLLRRIPGYNVIFHLEPATRGSAGGGNRLRLSGGSLARAEHLIRELRRELAEAAPGYEAASLALLTGLIVHVSRAMQGRRPPGEPRSCGSGRSSAGSNGITPNRSPSPDSPPWPECRRTTCCGSSGRPPGSTPIEHLLKVRLRRAGRPAAERHPHDRRNRRPLRLQRLELLRQKVPGSLR